MRHYCWQCYAPNEHATGVCAGCGGRIEAPEETAYAELLLWELGHPLPDRQMLAAELLGKLREPRAREPLQVLAMESPDPYLAAQALHSLLTIDGPDRHRELLERLVRDGGVPVRALARAALRGMA